MTYRHKQAVKVLGATINGEQAFELATIVRARKHHNSRPEVDAKVGDGFRIGKYQAPGEYIEGVWYIVEFATGVTLNAAHDYACARSAAHGWARVREFDLHGNLIWTATHDR